MLIARSGRSRTRSLGTPTFVQTGFLRLDSQKQRSPDLVGLVPHPPPPPPPVPTRVAGYSTGTCTPEGVRASVSNTGSLMACGVKTRPEAPSGRVGYPFIAVFNKARSDLLALKRLMLRSAGAIFFLNRGENGQEDNNKHEQHVPYLCL